MYQQLALQLTELPKDGNILPNSIDGALLLEETLTAVYAVTGQLIFSSMTQRVQLPQKGIFVVRTDKGSAKIAIK